MAEELNTSMLDARTPDEVNVTDEPREDVQDSTLGIPGEADRWGSPRNGLVITGDALTLVV